ncbi:hypothetical protein Mterra_03217 [Calidithermus terrae]|uniref:Bacterial bifunctional deaminase-reductase C-terminal domain-containing protein n=1 Tax=Calidithermus terrae TaxID=1408545 RepID=A0A399ECV8_9DEIN|nr:dihydrofolate reductase family protein [Calidithermus terrae]RIH81353.1 hypothetical protein Mterra_03217 [Calidithermus terrae]
MRKIVASLFMTLDGVVESPNLWAFDFGSPQQQRFKLDELFAADALLLGRVTYEGFAAAWPHMAEQTGEYGARMNSIPKHVVSSTLERADWQNSSLLRGDLAEAVGRLKQQPGQDVLIFGSPTLVGGLTERGLIDEYRLMVFPVLLGRGRRLFGEGGTRKTLGLLEARDFGSGVVLLRYAPAGGRP